MEIRSLMHRSMTLAPIAGLALSASVVVAQSPQQDQRSKDQARQTMNQRQRQAPQYQTFSAIKGWTVENPSGEELGSINDLIIDRGSGEIRFVVLNHGGALGIGGTNSLVQPRSMMWEMNEERATLRLSKRDLEGLPKLDSMDWDRQRDRDQVRRQDPYARSIETTSQRETVRGEITDVHRQAPDGGDELVVVTLDTNEGQSRDIVTGPSWFVMGRQTAPRRGEMVEFEVVRLPDDRDAWAVATTAMFDGERIRLRDRSGTATWSDPRRSQAEYGAPAHPFVQLTNVVGAPVVTMRRDAGEVQDALIDLSRERVGFLAIDPNENFLGMADTIRLVPWEIARYTIDEQVDIDATDQMVLSSPEMPDSPSQLNAGAFRDRVYRHFGIEPNQSQMDRRQSSLGAWGDNRRMNDALRNGESRRMRGELVNRRSTQNFPGMSEPVTVLLIRAENGDQQSLYAGPDAQVKTSLSQCRDGSKVDAEYRIVEIDGQRYMIATRLRHDNGVVTLWTPQSDRSSRTDASDQNRR